MPGQLKIPYRKNFLHENSLISLGWRLCLDLFSSPSHRTYASTPFYRSPSLHPKLHQRPRAPLSRLLPGGLAVQRARLRPQALGQGPPWSEGSPGWLPPSSCPSSCTAPGIACSTRPEPPRVSVYPRVGDHHGTQTQESPGELGPPSWWHSGEKKRKGPCCTPHDSAGPRTPAIRPFPTSSLPHPSAVGSSPTQRRQPDPSPNTTSP